VYLGARLLSTLVPNGSGGEAVLGSMDDLKDLKQRLQRFSNAELLRMVKVDFADYRAEALALAWQELKSRYGEADLQGLDLRDPKEKDLLADPQLAAIGFLFFIAATAVITFSLFAPILYYSVIAYGLPAAAFMATGYCVWAALVRRDSRRATAFAISFASPVVLLLTAQSTASPKHVGLILIEFSCFWLLLKLARVNGAKRPSQITS
jgi:hypothetical protein